MIRMGIDVKISHRSPSAGTDLPLLLLRAKAGDRAALGCLFERFGPFLLQIANEELDPRLRQKAGGSDLVQQTLLEAGQAIDRFQGATPDGFIAWLRRILLNNIANHRRHYHAGKRTVRREVQLSDDGSVAVKLDRLAHAVSSSSNHLCEQEKQSVVSQAFHSLPADYQLVISYRNETKRTFEEIGRLMDRSEDAARKLWARAIEALKTEIDLREHNDE